MTINEMFDELEDKARDTYIVTLKYKYDFEEKYTIENHILEYDSVDDSYAWINDWFEGQTDVEVLGYMLLGDVEVVGHVDIEGYMDNYEQGYKQGVSDVLDKIRPEIEFEVDHRTNMLCAEDVFEIIDRYKAESENKE